jgi:phosphatidate phosphatase PAH1
MNCENDKEVRQDQVLFKKDTREKRKHKKVKNTKNYDTIHLFLTVHLYFVIRTSICQSDVKLIALRGDQVRPQ